MTATADAPAVEKLAYTRRELAASTGLSEEFIKRAHHSGELKAKETTPGSRRYRYLADDVKAWLRSFPDG